MPPRLGPQVLRPFLVVRSYELPQGPAFLALFLVIRGLPLVLSLKSFELACSGFELFVDWLGLPLGFSDTVQFSDVSLSLVVVIDDPHEFLEPLWSRVEVRDFGLERFDSRAILGGLTGLVCWLCVHAAVVDCNCCNTCACA